MISECMLTQPSQLDGYWHYPGNFILTHSPSKITTPFTDKHDLYWIDFLISMKACETVWSINGEDLAQQGRGCLPFRKTT